MQKIYAVKIKGGLGNQMFQYAFIRALSLMHNCDYLLETTWFDMGEFVKRDIKRPDYQLSNLNISDKIISKEEYKKYHLNIPFINQIYEKRNYPGVFDKALIKNRNGNKLYVGYFQTEKYFKDYRVEILKDFKLKTKINDENKKMLEQIKSTNSVSLHIRRGEYLKLQEIFGLCSLDYYKNGVEYIASKVNSPHFYLFSDDITWVKENLKIDYPCTAVDINTGKTGYFDLELMKNCKHNIIANSSFSWWGAWLNENPEKIVVAPKQWLADKKTHTEDTICKDWIKL